MYNYKNKSQLPNQLDTIKRVFIRATLSLVLSFAIVYATKTFFLFPYTISNDFMEPSFKKGSRVYISYLFKREKLLIGDVVLVKMDAEASVLLARIVGRKGDRISIQNKKLNRNGNQISETDKILFTDKRSPFSQSFSNRDNLEEVLVKEKTYFLLADNRDEGVDSRALGLVSQNSIIGKVVF